MNVLAWLPAPSARQLAVVTVFVIGFIAGLRPLGDYDGWWHLAAGRLIVEQGHVAHTDPFSHTRAGAEWVMHEWGWEVALFGVWSRLGPWGVLLLKASLAGLTFATMLLLALRRRSNALVAVAVMALAAVAMTPWLNERPQALQPLLVLTALHLMQSCRKGRRRALLLYPALMAVWVNLHGSFPLGLVLLGLFALCELVRVPALGLRRALPALMVRPSAFLAGVLVLATVACFFNPAGARGALYPLDYFSGELDWATRAISEWRPPNWHHSYLTPLLALVFLTVAALALSPVSPALFDLLCTLLGLFMMLKWARYGPLFITLAAPIAAMHLTAWMEQVLIRRRRVEARVRAWSPPEGPRAAALGWALVVALIALATVHIPPRGDITKLIHLGRFPVAAAEVIALNDLQGNMLNAYHWGGYLIWRFYGDRRPVFIDGRADVYGEAVWSAYRRVSQARDDWRDTLDEYDVQYVLAEADWPICQALDLDPTFTRIHGDAHARLYVRTEGDNAQVVDRFRRGDLRLPPADLPDLDAILLAGGNP